MAREGTMTIVVSPTNFLQQDMSSSIQKKGITSMAINSETLTAAALASPKRDLWAEAKTGACRLILIGPETMNSAAYQDFIANKNVRSRLGQFTVDELHAADEWGVEFRKDFQDISTMRARLPEHTVFVGLSATVEPGRQFQSCVNLMGFQPDFHLHKGDCERHNVAMFIRPIKYTTSGLVFYDLDWVIPADVRRACDVPKRLIFVQTIEQGHRVVVYLRTLLPPHLRKDGVRLIRHHHSLACPDCKAEGMDSLYKVGEDRDALIHVATDVLTVGVDIPGLTDVLLYGPISSLSVAEQRAGRAVRERWLSGHAYVYVSKADMAAALEYINSDAGKKDARKNTTVAAPIQSIAKPGNRTCTSLLLVFAAHTRNRCITRQRNIIYDNPGKDKDCGRCSSCIGDTVPGPRAVDSTAPDASAAVDFPDLDVEKVPGYMKPTAKDLKEVAEKLEKSARLMRWSQARTPDALLIGGRVFLPPDIVSDITREFTMLMSEHVFRQRLCRWKHAEVYGTPLWNIMERLLSDLRSVLISRHEEVLEKQRGARVHKYIVTHGLKGITKIRLKVPPTTASPSRDALSATVSNNATAPAPKTPLEVINAEINPDHFYGGLPQKGKSRGSKHRLEELDPEPPSTPAAKRHKSGVSVTASCYLIMLMDYLGKGEYQSRKHEK
ncbi:P-loop containing nucleoside triphosphate hydrolase protein [Mycena belliarum]|uniref:DNA 3'-5' helicase n=1 Tax=Mycena belliarum TaxID=1033014 RepID=A0AAD6XN45_9AGAR|nr:P-loop containing nucleoside triphosphate hydrolase protein [Mycena belliae]